MNESIQIAHEEKYSKTFSAKYLKHEFEKANMYYLITDMVEELETHMNTAVIPENRPDLKEVYAFFTYANVEDMLWKMVSIILLKQSMTVAALAGVVFHSIKLENSHRKFLAIEHLLNLIAHCPLVNTSITKGEDCLFKANNELPAYIQEHVSAQGYPLPMLSTPVVTNNSSIGYMTFKESVIAGGALKHHDYNVVLSNINRANSVAYSSELRLKQLVSFTFNAKPKLRDDGLFETVEDIAKRYEDFVRMERLLPIKEAIIVDAGNKFHFAHRVDNRLRRYAKGYEFNYMSHKFIKAGVQFHNRELVQGDW